MTPVTADPLPPGAFPAPPQMTTDVTEIARIVRQGGLIAYPTEAVYGLGCRPADAAACERLLHLKRRDPGKGLILITDDLSRVAFWLQPVPTEAQRRAEATWPGPHTWLWPARGGCPPWLTGPGHRLAIRITAHPLVRALCAAAGTALISTSANLAGEPPCRDAAAVRACFPAPGDLDGILEGACVGATAPSTVRDLLTGAWLRGGPPPPAPSTPES